MERFSLIDLQILGFLGESFHKQKLSIIASTGITDQDDIPPGCDKLAGTAVIDGSLINRGLEGKIKIFYSLLGRPLGLTVTLTVTVLISVTLFIL
jgi:hypothetical protein